MLGKNQHENDFDDRIRERLEKTKEGLAVPFVLKSAEELAEQFMTARDRERLKRRLRKTNRVNGRMHLPPDVNLSEIDWEPVK
jgi:hypothetical protein